MSSSVLSRWGIDRSTRSRMAGVCAERSVSPSMRRSASLIGRDVDDFGTELLDELSRGEMEVDAARAAADRDQRLLERDPIDDHRQRLRRPERSDRATLVAGHGARLI